MTREEKFSGVNTARLLIDHPHSYRDWRILGSSSVRGFFHLESTFRLDPCTQSDTRTTFSLVLHETEFERVH
jgi:hypothetical protein